MTPSQSLCTFSRRGTTPLLRGGPRVAALGWAAPVLTVADARGALDN